MPDTLDQSRLANSKNHAVNKKSGSKIRRVKVALRFLEKTVLTIFDTLCMFDTL